MRSPRLMFSALLVGSVLLLSACGGSSSGGTASSSAVSTTEQKSGSEISAAALKASSAAKSVHIKGKAATINIDMQIAEAGAVGSVGSSAGSAGLLRVGDKYWIKGNAAFWTQSGLDAAKAAKLEGKYVDATARAAQFANLTSLKQFFGNSDSKTVTKGAVSTINGIRVIELKNEKSELLFVALDGEPFVARVLKSGSDGGQIDFTDWNKPVEIKVPDPSEVVDLKSLVGG